VEGDTGREWEGKWDRGWKGGKWGRGKERRGRKSREGEGEGKVEGR